MAKKKLRHGKRIQPRRPHVEVPGPGNEASVIGNPALAGLNIPYGKESSSGKRIQKLRKVFKIKPEKPTPTRKLKK